MKFYSLKRNSPVVSFKEAVIRGIAPDRGLYFPESLSPLDSSFISEIDQYSNTDIAIETISQFVEEDIPADKLRAIVEEVLQFDFPVFSQT